MDFNQSMATNTSSSSSRLHEFLPILTPMAFDHNQLQSYQMEQSMQHQLSMAQLQSQNLQLFWRERLLEMDQLNDHKQHELPLARVKRIMKSDEDVKMISADAPILFSKACELFILELTLRSWMFTEDCNRRTLQRGDIANAIGNAHALDFLLDIVPKGNEEEHEVITGENKRRTIPRMSNGLHFPAMAANPFNIRFNLAEEVALRNMRELQSRQSNGRHFPWMDANTFYQPYTAGGDFNADRNGGENQASHPNAQHFATMGANPFHQHHNL